MTPRQLMERVWACQPVERVPFIPAVYEQKAFLIGSTPSAVARDPDLLYQAMLAEHETYRADALVVGVDVYNLEPEAVGATVTYYDGPDTSIPGIRPGDHPLTLETDVTALAVPDPHAAGRMPVNLAVARRLAKLHETVPVRGALSGPFSLAMNLVGAEEFYIGTMTDPDACRRLIDYACQIIVRFGRAYLEAGVWTVLFDSQASPDLLPPRTFEQLVLPATQRVIAELRAAGDPYCPLIIGGNTTPIVERYLDTGSGQILCDFSADWPTFRAACERRKIAVRRNLSPALIQHETPDAVAATARSYLHDAAGMTGFILGTAVVPFGSPAANLAAARECCG